MPWVLEVRSRFCCHVQWYLDETAEALIHGLARFVIFLSTSFQRDGYG